MKQINNIKVLLKLLGIFAVFFFYMDIGLAAMISEIQFDPAGSDTDREWIEIFNDSNSIIDLTTYKFFENNTNHGIDILSGDKNVSSGEYVVLVQDLNKWKADYPAFSGKIFKSSFSLSNSGESLSLKDKDGNMVNTVNYNPVSTGAGNGLTINLNSDGSYAKGAATPGTGNLVVGTGTTDTGNTNNNSTTTTATSTQTTSTTTTSGTQDAGGFSTPIYYYRSYYPESQKIYVYAGENQLGVSGADIFFNGKAVTGDNRSADSPSFFWAFGDGETAEGASVHHAYKFPGEYVVNLEGYSNGAKNEDRIYVKITDPSLSISLNQVSGEKVVQISNQSKDQVDIGGYYVKSSGGEFEKVSLIGKRLTILPHKTTTLSQDLLKFATGTTFVSLAYNSGKVISEFNFVSLKATKTNSPIIKNVFATTTANVSIKVFTKEDFEKLSTSSLAVENNPVIVKKLAKLKIISIPKTSVASIPNQEKIDSEQAFVVKKENQNIFHSFLNYFGI